MAIKIIQNVPADQVDALRRLYTDAGATSIEVRVEDDNEFTLIVTYPDRETFASLSVRRVAV